MFNTHHVPLHLLLLAQKKLLQPHQQMRTHTFEHNIFLPLPPPKNVLHTKFIVVVKRKLLFVRQGEWDVSGDESYLYASDYCDTMTIDNRILASDNEPNPLEHFDCVTDVVEDRYCMRQDVNVFHI